MNALSMLLRVLAVAGAGAAVYFWVAIGDTKAKLQADLDDTKTKLSDTQADRDAKANEIESAKTATQRAVEDLQTEKSKSDKLYEQAQQLRKNITDVNAELETVKTSDAEKTQKIRDLEAEIFKVKSLPRPITQEQWEAAQSEITNLKGLVAEKQEVIDKLRAPPEIPVTVVENPVTVTPSVGGTPGGAPSTPSAAPVVRPKPVIPVIAPRAPAEKLTGPAYQAVVQDEKSGVIVINFGANQGARAGDRIHILDRGSKNKIVQAKISQALANQSVARAIPGTGDAGDLKKNQAVFIVVQ